MKRNCLDRVLGVQLLILVATLKNRRKKKTTAKIKRELLERLTKRQQERSGDDLAFVDAPLISACTSSNGWKDFFLDFVMTATNLTTAYSS